LKVEVVVQILGKVVVHVAQDEAEVVAEEVIEPYFVVVVVVVLDSLVAVGKVVVRKAVDVQDGSCGRLDELLVEELSVMGRMWQMRKVR